MSGAAPRPGACLDGVVETAEIAVTDLPDDAVVLDVREPGEWARGHVPNAVHLPMGEVSDQLANLPKLDGPLPVVCRSGGRSAKVVEFLRVQGVDAVNVTGGTQAWAAAGKPLAADEGEPTVI